MWLFTFRLFGEEVAKGVLVGDNGWEPYNKGDNGWQPSADGDTGTDFDGFWMIESSWSSQTLTHFDGLDT